MNRQSIHGNRNVQIQDVDRSLIEITYNEVPCTVPLEPALVPVAKRLPSPARLVRAHSGVVPYVDRAGLLSELKNWIDTELPFAGQVIGGSGGSGKTRLAVELCQVLGSRSWLCGFLSRIADPAMLDALVQAPTARLVVVDYAEARVEQLELLLPLLNVSATRQNPVRVLLLMRTGPSQEKGWSERLRNRIDSLDVVLDECDERILEETPLRKEEKAELFRKAAAAFAGHLDLPAPEPSMPRLTEDIFNSPLMVVIAAYLAAHGGHAPPATRAELLDEVLAHECRYWRESLADLDADEVLLGRMVALATMVNAETESQAADLLGLLPDLSDASAERRNRLARWVRAQYPGPRWWNPLEPDLVGEHLVAKMFTEATGLLERVLGGSDADGITRPLEVLARAAGDHAEIRNNLRPILCARLKDLCELAVTQGETAKDDDLLYGNAVTAAGALAAAVEIVKPESSALRSALPLLPMRPNVVLSELAATLTSQYAEECRRDGDPRHLAGVLNNLSNRLGDLGEHKAALAAIEESVELRRPLAAADPTFHTGHLAMGLNNLSNRLTGTSRFEEALAAIEESVDIYRGLAADDAATYRNDLAMGLSNLSNRLAEIGRHESALAAIEEAVEIRRPLAAADPVAHEGDLAMTLSNLCPRLAETGRYEEALKAIEEAVEIYRGLAAGNPAAYGLYLAMALNTLGIHLGEGGHHEEALAASEESVDLYRRLAAANPAAFRFNLGNALNNLCIHLAEVGRHEEALDTIEESVDIYRSLASAEGVYEAHLANALNSFGSRLANVKRYPEALAAGEEAVALFRALAATNPAAHTPALASALHNVANRLVQAERYEEALEAIEESVTIRRALATGNPTVYRPKLASSLKNLRMLLEKCRRDGEAERVRDELNRLTALDQRGASASTGGDEGVGAAPGEAPPLEADGGGEERKGEQAQ